MPSTGGLSEYSALRSNVVELAAYRPLQINDSPLLDFWKAATGSRFIPPEGLTPEPGLQAGRSGAGGSGSAGASGGSGGGRPFATPDGEDRDPPDGPSRPDDGDSEDDDSEDDDQTPIANRAPRVAGPVSLLNMVACGTLTISLADLLRAPPTPTGTPCRCVM